MRTFWRVVHALPLEDQKALLRFVCGSDRPPIGGLGRLQFKVQRNGAKGDDSRLPTASTCFNTLLLPDYSHEDVLRERLIYAIHECAVGFGLQ